MARSRFEQLRLHVSTLLLNSRPQPACLLLMGILVCCIAYSAVVHSPAVDEVGHLPSGIAHWHLNRFEPYAVNPHLVRMVASTPVLTMNPKLDWSALAGKDIKVSDRVEWKLGRRFVELNGPRAMTMWAVARLILIPFVLLGAWVVYRWSRSLSDAGCVALALFVFSPTILGHGSMMTPDTVAAGFGVMAAMSFRRWLRTPSLLETVLSGTTFSVAVMAKSTWLVVLPAFAIVQCGIEAHCATLRWDWWQRCMSLASMVCIVVMAINGAYGFERTLTPLEKIPFSSQALSHNEIPGVTWERNRFIDTSLGRLPIPLPASFIEGLDVQRKDFDAKYRSYLMGEWKFGGWWYYYLIGFLVKEPIGFQLMLYVSMLHGLWNWKRWTRESIREWSLIVTPPLLIFGLVSSQTGFNHHMRYVLPAYPFLFIIAARTVTLGKLRKWFSYACLTWQAATVLWFAPHWMSYYNEAAGGPKNGHKWLVDSNIDWGQDILMLKWWQDKHPEAAPLHAAMFTGFDPKDIGLKYKLPAPFVKGHRETVSSDGPRGPQPGWYAVSVCMFKGHHFNVPEGDGEWSWSTENFTYFFDNFEPVEMIGYSIYIYHITEDNAARVRAKLLAEEAEFLKTERVKAGVEGESDDE